jgi:TonB family protein
MRFSKIAAVFLLFCAIHASAETPKEIANRLGPQLVGKGFMLMQPRRGTKLKFSEDGTLLSKSDRGTWAAHAGFLVQSVSSSSSQLELKGKRLLIYFDTAGKRQSAVTSSSLEVDLELGANTDSRKVEEAIGGIFMVNGNSPADVLPPEIPDAALLADDSVVVVGKMPDGVPLYRGSRRVRPRAIRTPDPHYPAELKNKSIKGGAHLRIVVAADGTVQSIAVESTTQPGFEVASADAVKDWLFSPATVNGQPVPVVVRVEVNFYLY